MTMAANGSSPVVSPKASPTKEPSAPASPAAVPVATTEPVTNGHAADDSAAVEAKQAELEALQREVSSLKKSEEEGEAKELAENLAALEADIAVLDSETDALRAKEATNVEEMQRLGEEKKRLEQERDAKIESLEASAEQLAQQTDEIKQKISAFEKSTRGEESRLQKDVDTARSALEKQQAENDEKMRAAQNDAGTLPLEQKVQTLQAKISKMKADQATSSASLETAQTGLAEAKAALAAENAAFSTLLEESEAELKQLKDASRASQDQANALTAETNRQIDASSARKQEIQSLESEVKLFQQQKAELKAKTEEAAVQLEELKKKTVDFNSRKFRAEADVKKVQAKSGHAVSDEKTRVEKLTKTVGKERERVATAKQSAENLKTQFEQQFALEVERAKAARTQGKQEEIKDEKRLLEEQRGDNDQLRIRVKALENAVQQERQKTREINSRNNRRA